MPPVWKQQIRNNNWTDESNHKRVFDEYAKSHGFDPLVASNWYEIEVKDLKQVILISF